MQDKRKIVTLQSVFESSEWQNANARLPLALGKDTDGNVIVPDLARMPHLLISGGDRQWKIGLHEFNYSEFVKQIFTR